MSTTMPLAIGWPELAREHANDSEIEHGARLLDGARAALRPLVRPWEEIAVRSAAAPFAHPAFVMATARLLASGDHRIAIATRGAEVVGVLPLTRQGRTLVSLATVHTPRFDFCGRRSALVDIFRALLATPGWDVLRLERVPRASWLASDLPALARDAGCAITIAKHLASPRFSLRDFESRLSSKFRGELRRAEAKLGALSFERIADWDRRAFEEALAIELAAWKGSAGTAIACDPPTRRFYESVLRWASRQHASTIAFLRRGEKRVAMHLAIESDGVYHLLKTGYDPELAAHSPGQLMVKHAAEDARARGLHTFDLLGRDEAWKMKWTSLVEEHLAMTVYRGTPLGRARFVATERCRPIAGRARRWMREHITPSHGS